MNGLAQTAATGPLLVAIGLSVLAGLVSFASPCVIPLVPGFLSYLAAAVGADSAVPWQGRPASVQVDVPPLGVLWLAAERPPAA